MASWDAMGLGGWLLGAEDDLTAGLPGTGSVGEATSRCMLPRSSLLFELARPPAVADRVNEGAMVLVGDEEPVVEGIDGERTPLTGLFGLDAPTVCSWAARAFVAPVPFEALRDEGEDFSGPSGLFRTSFAATASRALSARAAFFAFAGSFGPSPESGFGGDLAFMRS